MARTRAEIVAALLLGLAAFLLVVGPAPLDPTNIAWLSHSDAVTNYLGWAFFRASPWSWPLAANPAYGIDIAGSVMMADANPLLALSFKLIGPWLPQPFQYFGWWLLLCFLLQALFARALAARLTPHPEQRLAIATLFLFAPCFLIRIATPAICHMTLCGQWQILAALWLYLSPGLPRRALAWTLLLTISVLTHPYLLVFVAAVWLADLFRLLIARRAPIPAIAGHGILPPITAWASAKLLGLFWLARPLAQPAGEGLLSYREWGFAYYRANLLSPFNPEGWSWVLPTLPTNKGEIEGFGFLGLGVLALAVAALIFARRAWPKLRIGSEHVPLILALLALTMLAVSYYVAVGTHVVMLPWPEWLIGIGNLFRSSGRFIWLAVYCAMLAICWLVARGAGRRTGSALLIAAALIQVADGSAGWRAYAGTLDQRGTAWPTSLKSPFWACAGKRYRAVRLVVPRNRLPAYQDLGAWALEYRLVTDVVYLARSDPGAIASLAQRRATEMRVGRLAHDSLWITDGVPADRLAAMPRRDADLIAVIDGIPLFAPGLAACLPKAPAL